MSSHPSRQLNSRAIIDSLQNNIMPLIKKTDGVLARRAIFADEDKLSICNVRFILDELLANMKIKFFISCVSGTQSNPKKRGETRPQDPFRACINFFICYEKSIIQEHEIFQGFHNATDTKFENKPMVTKSSTNDRESIFRMLQQTVKDHNSKCIQTLIHDSLFHCFEKANPTMPCDMVDETVRAQRQEVCRLHCCDIRIAESFSNASKNLTKSKLVHIYDGMGTLDEDLPEAPPSSNLSKAADKISELMKKLNYRLYRGMVYFKPEEAKFTFKLLCDPEEFLCKVQTNAGLKELVLANNANLLKHMSSIHTELFPKIKIDYDFIEVKNNTYLKLSSRAYVSCPFTDDEFGVTSPRSFHDFDPYRTNCHGGFMASAIEHWFPRLEDQVKLAHRIYQCLLCFQLPDKTRKLTLIGKIDSGKTSIMNFFSALIPEEKISILTKETTFGLSMITDDTELLYVDEWTREMTPPDIAKMLFQNGRFPQAIKFKSPKMRKDGSWCLLDM
ncbi:uncharacterized protein [Clytia hemisphaerica]|uniref:uncharacterized protein n=2 Tax=Clytia hemisphaerica TaxID=252671 RepID=UPI0034D4328C